MKNRRFEKQDFPSIHSGRTFPRIYKTEEFHKKFAQISKSKKLNELLYTLACTMIEHRNGTNCEDMYWIDLDTLDVVAKETDGTRAHGISYSKNTIEAIGKYEHLLTIHSHPSGMPPSVSDLNSNFSNDYEFGVVVTHNGKVFLYRANEPIDRMLYNEYIEKFRRSTKLDEYRIQMKVLYELGKKYRFSVKEMKTDGK